MVQTAKKMKGGQLSKGPSQRSTSDFRPLLSLPPGAAGTVKNPHSHPVWEVSHGILALLGWPEAFCVTHGWAHTLFGLGLMSGCGFKKRLCPQLTCKAVCAGATWLD